MVKLTVWVGLAVLVYALPLSARAGIEDASSEDICSGYAMTLLTGKPLRVGVLKKVTQQQLKDVMAARGIDCEPIDRYFEIAKFRLRQRAEEQQAFEAEMQRQQDLRDRRREERELQDQQRKPLRTTCRQMGTQTDCTTTSGGW